MQCTNAIHKFITKNLAKRNAIYMWKWASEKTNKHEGND